jgi:hypothetical protein
MDCSRFRVRGCPVGLGPAQCRAPSARTQPQLSRAAHDTGGRDQERKSARIADQGSARYRWVASEALSWERDMTNAWVSRLQPRHSS